MVPLVTLARALRPSDVLNPVDDAMINGAPPNFTSVDDELLPVAVEVANESMPIVSKSVKCAVELACNPAWNQIGVAVAFASAPKLVVAVNGKPSVDHEALPPLPEMHVPLIEKQPPDRLMPPAP